MGVLGEDDVPNPEADYPLVGFENKRSFLSIENLCFIINQLLTKKIPSDVYQVADDEPLSTNEVVSILALSMHNRPKLWPISPAIVKFLKKLEIWLNCP